MDLQVLWFVLVAPKRSESASLSDKDIARVRKQVERWSDLESKALDELFDG